MTQKMRNFNPDERALSMSNIARHKSNLDYWKYKEKYCLLMLDEGLEQEYLAQRKAKMSDLKNCQNQIKEAEMLIKITEDQLKNGVAVKTPSLKEMKKESEE